MPEGHTLRRLANLLTDHFAGTRPRVLSPQGRFASEARSLDGAPFVGADAAGKHLFCEFEGERYVHIHLGLIGGLDVAAYDEVPDPVGAVRLRLVASAGDRVVVADLRGATRCDLVGRGRVDDVIASLGPDPLRDDADPDRAWQRISRSRRTIADLLMDQAVVAGVGNVYRAEVLFRQRLDPFRPGTSLRRRQWQAIWDDLVVLMGEGVRLGRIDTVRPEHTPEAMGRPPRVDDHGGEVYVYRRHGLTCHICHREVRTQTVAGRNLFWCPGCQRRYRPSSPRPGRASRSPGEGSR